TVDAEEWRQRIRDVGYGIRDTWVGPAEAVPDIAPMTVGEVNTRVTELAELHEHDTQDLKLTIRMLRIIGLCGWWRRASAPRSLAYSIGLIQATHPELQTHRDHVHETRFLMQQTELVALRETDRRRQDQMVETLRVIRDLEAKMSDMQAHFITAGQQKEG
ncbi:hypothetical protein Tco_1153421, partial [Tanacetum coccineum]